MNRTNKKGFTIVELVIVIAVIAILAAVLIPNLSRLVTKANESARLQEVESALKVMLMTQTDGALDDGTVFVYDGKYYYVYTNGQLEEKAENETVATDGKVEFENQGKDTTETFTETGDTTTYEYSGVSDLGKVKVYLSTSDAKQYDSTKVKTN